MWKFCKKKPAVGLGLGVGLIGAVALAVRYGVQRATRQPIPDTISPAIFATRVAATTHGEIIYHTSGAGAPLLFLHGIYPGASSFEWSKVYPDLAIGHEVIAPDLIGFGESQRPRHGLDADEHAQALADFLFSVCDGRPATLVASGFGASVALKLAVQHPDLVSALILFAPVGLDSSLRRIPLGLAALSRTPVVNHFVYRNYFARKPFIRGWLARLGFVDASKITNEIVEMLASCANQYGADHAMLAFFRGRLLYDVKSQLPRVTQPVTILWPAAEDRFSGDLPQRLGAAIRNCRVVSAGALGSLGPLEAPERVRDLVTDALDGEIPFSSGAGRGA